MKQKAQEPEGFAEFWAVWRPIARHTDGRGLARDTYRKHLAAGADAQDIIDGARCFIRTMADKDKEFVPLSSTWLNRGAYEDLCEQERDFQARLAASRERSEKVVPIRPEIDRLPELSEDEKRRRAEQAERAKALFRGTASKMGVH